MRVLLFILMVLFIFSACKSPREKALADIYEAETELFLDTNAVEYNKEKAQNLIGEYKEFAEKFPEDSLAPDYLFKAGEIYISINEYKEAINTFYNVYDNYKNYKKRPNTLFMIAFIHENYLQQYEKAKDLYSRFIKEHPEHELRDDAEFSLANLGKSPEEILKQFEEKYKNSGKEDTTVNS